MSQWFAGNSNFNITKFGEIGETQTSRLLALAEHDLFVRAMQRPPCFHTALESALALVGKTTWVTILEVFKERDGHKTRFLLQQGQDLTLPDCCKGVFARTPMT